jgi:cold shock CspA family protein
MNGTVHRPSTAFANTSSWTCATPAMPQQLPQRHALPLQKKSKWRLKNEKLDVPSLQPANDSQSYNLWGHTLVCADDGLPKDDLAVIDVCESETTAAEEKSSVSSEGDVEEVDECGNVEFHGTWGPARIHNGKLTWNEGEDIVINVESASKFSMSYLGSTYSAELCDDGKLHWNDGDVWTRRDAQPTTDAKVYPPWRRTAQRKYLVLPALTEHPTQTHSREELKRQSAALNEEGRTIRTESKLETQPEPEAPRLCKVPSKVQRDKAASVALPPWLCGASGRKQRRNCAQAPVKTAPEAPLKTAPEVQVTVTKTLPVQATPMVISSKDDRSCRGAQSQVHQDRFRCEPSFQAEEDLAVPSAAMPEASPPKDRLARGKARVVSAPTCLKQYQGVVNWFRGTFGWVESADVARMYPNHDVFVHINDCDFNPRQWDKVCFQLAEEDGKPKAVSVCMWREPARIDARNWFGSDRTGKRDLLASWRKS